MVLEEGLAQVQKKYRTRISPFIYQLIKNLPKEEAEKILKQFEPSIEELKNPAGYVIDPLSEEDFDIQPIPGLIHKYPNKVLYLTTSECPVYCRFCTRKRKTLVGEKTITNIEKVLAYIKKNPQINEVIFSGGDPFMLPAKEIKKLAFAFAEINQISFLRWHSRVITTLPSRFNKLLWQTLKEIAAVKQTKTIVTHINTAAEISKEAIEIIQKLQDLNFLILNQSVLLKGINDNLETLKKLFLTLHSLNIRAYYLHQLDPVEGSAHFAVPLEEGIALFKALSQTLPIALLPRYVQDSKAGKTNLAY